MVKEAQRDQQRHTRVDPAFIISINAAAATSASAATVAVSSSRSGARAAVIPVISMPTAVGSSRATTSDKPATPAAPAPATSSLTRRGATTDLIVPLAVAASGRVAIAPPDSSGGGHVLAPDPTTLQSAISDTVCALTASLTSSTSSLASSAASSDLARSVDEEAMRVVLSDLEDDDAADLRDVMGGSRLREAASRSSFMTASSSCAGGDEAIPLADSSPNVSASASSASSGTSMSTSRASCPPVGVPKSSTNAGLMAPPVWADNAAADATMVEVPITDSDGEQDEVEDARARAKWRRRGGHGGVRAMRVDEVDSVDSESESEVEESEDDDEEEEGVEVERLLADLEAEERRTVRRAGGSVADRIAMMEDDVVVVERGEGENTILRPPASSCDPTAPRTALIATPTPPPVPALAPGAIATLPANPVTLPSGAVMEVMSQPHHQPLAPAMMRDQIQSQIPNQMGQSAPAQQDLAAPLPQGHAVHHPMHHDHHIPHYPTAHDNPHQQHHAGSHLLPPVALMPAFPPSAPTSAFQSASTAAAAAHAAQQAAQNAAAAQGRGNHATVYTAIYSGIPVHEMVCRGIPVMRRVSDGYLNATQILKVAGFSKPKRTKILEKEILQGEHEKVQGGYGKYQGTWIPKDVGRDLARRYNVESEISTIIDFDETKSVDVAMGKREYVLRSLNANKAAASAAASAAVAAASAFSITTLLNTGAGSPPTANPSAGAGSDVQTDSDNNLPNSPSTVSFSHSPVPQANRLNSTSSNNSARRPSPSPATIAVSRPQRNRRPPAYLEQSPGPDDGANTSTDPNPRREPTPLPSFMTASASSSASKAAPVAMGAPAPKPPRSTHQLAVDLGYAPSHRGYMPTPGSMSDDGNEDTPMLFNDGQTTERGHSASPTTAFEGFAVKPRVELTKEQRQRNVLMAIFMSGDPQTVLPCLRDPDLIPSPAPTLPSTTATATG
ncbi:hypothetical protein HK101_001327, partial [Irineochytrium annulatum]